MWSKSSIWWFNVTLFTILILKTNWSPNKFISKIVSDLKYLEDHLKNMLNTCVFEITRVIHILVLSLVYNYLLFMTWNISTLLLKHKSVSSKLVTWYWFTAFVLQVHGAFAGYSGITVGTCNTHYAYFPIPEVISHPKLVDSNSRMWHRCLTSTGQPDFIWLFSHFNIIKRLGNSGFHRVYHRKIASKIIFG